MKKRLLMILTVAALLAANTINTFAYTVQDVEALFENETDKNVHDMGIATLKKELGISDDIKYDKRTVGTFNRSDNDFITMISLLDKKIQSFSGLTEQRFTLHLSKDDIYDEAYYKNSEEDLEILLYHINNVKTATEGMTDVEKVTYLNDYISSCFTYLDNNTSNSAVLGFKTGIAVCRGYTSAFYIIGRNIGLDVKAEMARIPNGIHSYNVVKLNGQDYVVDVTGNDIYNTHIYLMMPYDEYLTTAQALKYKDSLADKFV